MTDTTDANYFSLVPKILFPVTNLDDDVASVAVERVGTRTETSEAGASQVFSVRLDSQPYGPVTVSFASTDTTEGAVDLASIEIGPSDYDVPQLVTVRGVDDSLDDGDQPYTVTVAVASAADGAYNGMLVPALSFTNTDDDTAELLAKASGERTYESGQAVVTVSLTLATEPAQGVTVTATVSDASEAVVDPASVTFSAADYAITQTFTVSGLKDYTVDGTVACV